MKCFFLAVLSLTVSCTLTLGQISLVSMNGGLVLDFSDYTGLGYDPTTAGFLDSDHWRLEGVNGVADATVFGGTETNQKYERGASAGGNNSGGIYSYDVRDGVDDDAGQIRTLGVSPNVTNAAVRTFEPGAIELRVVNDTGSTVTGLNFIFDLYTLNDKGSGYDLKFLVDGVDQVAGGHSIATGKDSGTVQWVQNNKSGSALGLNWTTGTNLIFRWEGAAAAGTAVDEQRFDEFALDNIQITAIPEPSTYALIFGGIAAGLVVFVKRRRAPEALI